MSAPSLGGHFPQTGSSIGGTFYGGLPSQVDWRNNYRHQPGGLTNTQTVTDAGTEILREYTHGGYGPSTGQIRPQQYAAQPAQTTRTTQSQPSSQRSWWDPRRYVWGKSNTSAPNTPQRRPQSIPSSTPGFPGYTPHSQTTDPNRAAQEAEYQAWLSQMLQAQGGSLSLMNITDVWI